jgi:hypothetical protein
MNQEKLGREWRALILSILQSKYKLYADCLIGKTFEDAINVIMSLEQKHDLLLGMVQRFIELQQATELSLYMKCDGDHKVKIQHEILVQFHDLLQDKEFLPLKKNHELFCGVCLRFWSHAGKIGDYHYIEKPNNPNWQEFVICPPCQFNINQSKMVSKLPKT